MKCERNLKYISFTLLGIITFSDIITMNCNVLTIKIMIYYIFFYYIFLLNVKHNFFLLFLGLPTDWSVHNWDNKLSPFEDILSIHIAVTIELSFTRLSCNFGDFLAIAFTSFDSTATISVVEYNDSYTFQHLSRTITFYTFLCILLFDIFSISFSDFSMRE